MAVTSQNIIDALKGNDTLQTDEWRRVTEMYPYCEVFVWHYMRALFRSDDLSMESEMERLAMRVGDRQRFYNFVTQPKVTADVNVEYGDMSADYFAQQDSETQEQRISLTDLARKLREARIAAKEKREKEAQEALCTTTEQKNDIAERPNEEKKRNEEKKKVNNTVNEREKYNNQKTAKADETYTQKAEKMKVTQAKVTELIQRKKYSEALEILRRENDENSKKNSYFAIQIKYLETIINNR